MIPSTIWIKSGQLTICRNGHNRKQSPHSTLVILQKFLRANAGDLAKAKAQLLAALQWRKTYNPLAARDEAFSHDKFGGLGYITTVTGAAGTVSKTNVAAFNIYGAAAKDPSKTFGDTDAFVRWRVALMERTLQALELDKADKTIPDYNARGSDPYQAIQVHDYQSVSFFRQPAEIKASSARIIEMFQKYYPETVSALDEPTRPPERGDVLMTCRSHSNTSSTFLS